MGIKDKLPLIRSESRTIRIFGYVVYAFAILLIIGILTPSETPDAPPATPTQTPEAPTSVATPDTPTVTPTPTLDDPDVEDNINILKDGQSETVECKTLSVFGDNNVINIGNKDIEKILITGHGNSISYSCDADPKIIDHGNYNDVWQRWLT